MRRRSSRRLLREPGILRGVGFRKRICGEASGAQLSTSREARPKAAREEARSSRDRGRTSRTTRPRPWRRPRRPRVKLHFARRWTTPPRLKETTRRIRRVATTRRPTALDDAIRARNEATDRAVRAEDARSRGGSNPRRLWLARKHRESSPPRRRGARRRRRRREDDLDAAPPQRRKHDDAFKPPRRKSKRRRSQPVGR